MIEVRDLTVRYGDTAALDGANFFLKKGTFCAVVGPSGSGKSTLLLTLAGLIAPTSGTVTVDGAPLTGPRQKTSLVLQDLGLLPWKTGLQNVAFVLRARGVPRAEAREKAAACLARLGVADCAGKYPDEMSGGQKQRVAVARALVTEPDLLLMDEASSALDAFAREALCDLILSLRRDDLTPVYATHNIEDAVILGQKIFVIRSGKIARMTDNPLFGAERPRERPEFYEMCRKVREALRD